MSKKATAKAFADWIASKVQTPAIPYILGGISEKGTDCINLIRWALWELIETMYSRGSNTAWRNDMTWRGTIAEAKRLGYLLPGAIVYIDYGYSDKWNDEWGAMDHAGIYVGFDYGLKNPDGKPADVVHASSSREGVYGSILAKNAWTHVALHKGVDYGFDSASEPEQDEPIQAETPAPNSEPEPGQAKVVTNEGFGLNLRKKPNRKAAGIKTMPDDTIVDVFEVANGWARVKYVAKDGVRHMGWCAVEYLVFG